MPVYQPNLSRSNLPQGINSNNNYNNSENNNNSRPFVTTDATGRTVTINVAQDHLVPNTTSQQQQQQQQGNVSDYSFDDDDEDEDEDSVDDFRLRYLNLRGDTDDAGANTYNYSYNSSENSRRLNRPYLNPNNNFINSGSSSSRRTSNNNNNNNNMSSNDRFRQAMLTPLPPPPPPQRRGTFNSEIPNSASSTLSVNRDTGNVSLSTYTNNSINLNNSILRRVMHPNNRFNNHQQFSDLMENNNNESHIRQEDFLNNTHNNTNNGGNAATFSLLSDINRYSTQSFYNDLNSQGHDPQQEPSNQQQELPMNYLFNHQEHSFNINRASQNINLDLNEFLAKRREVGDYYNKHLKFKAENPKKRDASQLSEGSITSHYEGFHFNMIRVKSCSFLKPGLSFMVKNLKSDQIPFTIAFISVDYQKNLVRGSLNFEHLYLMKHWLSENAPDNAFINISSNNTVQFSGELVDFENTDLRYNSYSLESFNNSIADDIQNHSKNFRLIYNNCITRKQLSRWKKLKPFQNLNVKDMIPLITCNECLSKLQENFLLMKIYIDCHNSDNDDQLFNEVEPTILICVDRRTGELELISAEGKAKTIAEQYASNLNNEINDQKVNNSEDTVTLMSMKCKKYVSPSLQFC
ncbi:unnamed protein product [Wickerhamomyces anomalus]